MNYIKNFAFFWIGSDISIPSYLVKSINIIYGSNANIYMLTDKKTPYIEGVYKSIRTNLPKDIMLARLKAYSSLKIDEQCLFLDADSILINKIEELDSKSPFVIFRRKREGLVINHHYPEWYPEFQNKTFDEMMPYMFGLMFSQNINSNKNFTELLDLAKKLPSRFHRWYGDQYALKLAVENSLINYEEMEINQFVTILSGDDLNKKFNKPIITFKGKNSKNNIDSVYKKIFNGQK